MTRAWAWWQGLSTWARWALVLVPAVIIVLRALFARRPAIEAIRATVRAEEAERRVEETLHTVEEAVTTQPARDKAIDDAAVTEAREEVEMTGDGAKDLRPGIRGGKLPGGDFDDEFGL